MKPEISRVHPRENPELLQQPPPEVGGDYRHGPNQVVGQANNKKEALENEEDDETDTLVVSDTGASVDCQDVMHEMEVHTADKVVEIDDAWPYLEEDDDSSRATTEETQVQNMTMSTSPAPLQRGGARTIITRAV